MIKDKMSMRGFFRIQAIDVKTRKIVREWQIENQLTAINRTVRTAMLTGKFTGAANVLQLRYFAFGTGTTEPNENQTQLVDEQFRKPLTQLYESNGNVISVVSLQANEANFRIREIGVFCGGSASAAADSGTMLSRIICDIDKNQNIVLNIVRTDTTALG